jgi:hypothetical protein
MGFVAPFRFGGAPGEILNLLLFERKSKSAFLASLPKSLQSVHGPISVIPERRSE